MSDADPGRFAATRWSRVCAAGAGARVELAWLCERYWQPLCRHVQGRGHGADTASDLTQDFFVHLLERDLLAKADPARGRFRSFLLGCLDRHLAQARRHAAAACRAGATAPIGAGTEPAIEDPDASARFDAEWARQVAGLAHDRLAAEVAAAGQGDRWRLLGRWLTAPPDAGAYAAAAIRLGLGEVAVKVTVHRWRQRYRELVEAELRETLADPQPQAVADELAALLAAAGR